MLKRHNWDLGELFWNLPTGLLCEFELHMVQILNFCEFQSVLQFVDVNGGVMPPFCASSQT